MVPLSEIPLNSFVWLLGAAACLMLGYRSFVSYRSSTNELSKYVAWFGVLMGIGQLWLAIPAFFTHDSDNLRLTYLIGEFFIYSSAVAQAAILWCIILRSMRLSIRAVTIPVAVVGFIAWFYALPRSTLRFSGNFINYRDPTFSTVIIGVLLIGLFVPVGVYFLRSAVKQTKSKAVLNGVALGLVYVGVGFFTGGIELLTGQVITPKSAIGDTAFFSIMLVALAWRRRPGVRSTVESTL
jgi:hypothetical protein